MTLAILRAIWELFPPRVWIELAIAAMVIGILTGLHLHLEAGALDRQKVTYEKRIQAQHDEYEAKLQQAHDTAQAALDHINTDWQTAWAKHQIEDAARDAARQKQIDTLKEGFNRYVSPIQIARCPDVPRGYLVRRANAAAYANGTAETAGPPAAASALDEPSGVSLAALDAVDIAAAGAYRSCRDRIAEWERWGDAIVGAYAEAKRTFEAPQR